MAKPKTPLWELKARGSKRAKLRERLEVAAQLGEPRMPERVACDPAAARAWRGLCERLRERDGLHVVDGELVANAAVSLALSERAAEATSNVERIDDRRAAGLARLQVAALGRVDKALRRLGLDRLAAPK